MQRKALAINLTVILVAMVATLLILLGLTRVGSGQSNRATDSWINEVQGLMSMCDTTIDTPVDFNGLMNEMSKIANDCDADKTKCGKKVCMTANFGNSGDYYKINEYNLHDNNLDRFNNYLIRVGVLSWGANVYCEKTNADGWGYEIDPYYTGGAFDRSGLSTSLPNIKTADGTKVCQSESAIHGEFAVAHGSKVMITPTYIESIIGHTVDLKVVVKGGTYTHDKTPSPYSECTPGDDTPCNSGGKPKWGHCVDITTTPINTDGKCQNPGYCLAYPAKCKSFTVTCTQTHTENTCSPNALTTDCIPPGTFASTDNGYKTTIGYLTQGGSLEDKKLALYVIKDSKSGNTFIANGKEKWFGAGALCLFGPCEVSSSDPNAKVSVAVNEIKKTGDTYKITVSQGCY